MNGKVKIWLVIAVTLFVWVELSGQSLFREEGEASWYGPGFHGKTTASGERFNTNDFTAAHKTLPFGTRVRVTNTDNNLTVVVRINDRGPFVRGRIIDLSRAAADKLNMLESGIAHVIIETLAPLPTASRSQAGPAALSVQAASFSDRDNANALARRLQDAGINAEVVNAGRFFRVIIENIAKEELPEILSALKLQGIANPLVR